MCRMVKAGAIALAGGAVMLAAAGGLAPAQAKEIVAFDAPFPIGAVVVDTSARKLYYALGNGHAIRYSIAVGKPRFQWFGQTFVERKAKDPGWSPTPRMRRLGAPAYVPPGPRNPLGVRAIYLGWTEYRIHGTNAPGSIGGAVSSGCFRMQNDDVVDLYERVHIGAPVYVMKSMRQANELASNEVSNLRHAN